MIIIKQFNNILCIIVIHLNKISYIIMKTNRVIKRPKCISDGCNIRPSFNITGEKIALFCKAHKTEEMVDVITKHTCNHKDCNKHPLFNIKGEKRGACCKAHKTEEMVNVKERRICIHENCNKYPSFNIKGEKRGLCCKAHKTEEMVFILPHDICIHNGCNKIPTFNNKGEKIALYCKSHKAEEMVNVRDKRCNHENCDKIPMFNMKSKTNGLYCKTHKTLEMVNVVNKRICIIESCEKQSCFNNPGEKRGLYCKIHKSSEMVDVINKHCKTYLCYTQVKPKYNGYCFYCYINMFPNKPVSRNYKTKEYAIVEFIKSLDVNLSWISDKRVSDGCSKRRPDLLLDLGYQVIIIEVDENQHIDYDCSCENKRLMELSYDLGHRPIIFIRFNPDDYTDKFNKKISSCWGNNKNGINVVKKSKMIEWEDRLNSLKNCVEYWINPENVTNKTIEIIQLFYDEDKI